MSDNLNFQSFLFISPKKIIISINHISSFEEFYRKEKLIKNSSNKICFKSIKEFLDENIFDIEKILSNFVEKIFLIIDYDNFLPVKISIKKNNYNQFLTKDSLKYSLNEVLDECKKTFGDRKIMHMIIENYNIDNKDYSSLPENIRCNNFFLDIKFICIPNNLFQNLQEILKNYHISINRVISAKYVHDFFPQNERNLLRNTKDLIDGCNENEIQFVNKPPKYIGFFEKFFKLFS